MDNILSMIATDNLDSVINSSSYVNKFGIKVPRVTEILSAMMHSDNLMYWANNLGFKGIGSHN